MLDRLGVNSMHEWDCTRKEDMMAERGAQMGGPVEEEITIVSTLPQGDRA